MRRVRPSASPSRTKGLRTTLGSALLAFLCLQTEAEGPPAGVHPPSFYRDADGALYAPSRLPLFLFAGGTRENGDALHLHGTPGDSLHLAEGPNRLAVEGGGTVYTIYADGTPPRSSTVFGGAARHSDGQAVYYSPGLSLGLTAHDSLAGIARIYVATDSTGFRPFDAPLQGFAPDSLHTVWHYAVDRVGNAETPRHETFRIDGTPPQTSLQVEGHRHGDVLAASATLVLQGGDALSGLGRIAYRLDQHGADYAGPVRLDSLEDGEHWLRWTGFDRVGNAEAEHAYRFWRDSTPPTLTFAVEGETRQVEDAIYLSPAARVRLEAADAIAGVQQVRYSLQSGAPNSYAAAFGLPDTSGFHRLAAWAADSLGNSSDTLRAVFYLDRTPPQTAYAFSGRFYSSADTFTVAVGSRLGLSAVDLESGLAAVAYRLDGGEKQVYTDSLEFTAPGPHLLVYGAVDRVGNRERERTLHVNVAETLRGPQAPDAQAGAKRWYHSDATGLVGPAGHPFYLRISASPDDTAATFLLGGPTTEGDAPPVFAAGGARPLQLGLGERQQRLTVGIDDDAPRSLLAFSGTESSDGPPYFYGPGLALELRAEDPGTPPSGVDAIHYSVDGSPFIPYLSPLELFHREKPYTVAHYAVDRVGNAEEPRTSEFVVDLTPPQARHRLEGHFFGRALSPHSIIVLEAEDNLSGVGQILYRVDDGPTLPYSAPLGTDALAGLTDGSHVLRYRAVDRVGNRGPEKEFGFDFDTAAPRTALEIEGDSHRRGDSLFVSSRSRVRLQAPEGTALRYRFDSGPPLEYAGAFSLEDRAGTYRVGVEATDRVGNRSPREDHLLHLDRTPPTPHLQVEGLQYREDGGLFVSPDTRFALSATDAGAGVGQIFYRVDDGPTLPYGAPFAASGFGEHTVRYHAVDRVNNRGEERVFAFFLDDQPPDISLTYSQPPVGSSPPLLPAGTILYIETADRGTEVEKVTYSFDGSEERLYRSPLSGFRAGFTFDLRVRAVDRLENLREYTVTLRSE